jgi:mRNA interferase HigB
VELLNAIELHRAATKHPQVGPWLAAWRLATEAAAWKSIVDVRQMYPSADGVTLGKARNKIVVTIFNAGGNDFRLLTRISYAKQLVQVEEVLTHAEYSKGKWRGRYQ